MKPFTSSVITIALLFSSTSPALAGDPTEAYDEFVPTDRGNADYEAQCREELGFTEETLMVGAQLFNLRRCKSKLRARDTGRQARILRERTVRMEARRGRASQFADRFKARADRSKSRFSRQKQRMRVQFREKKPTTDRLKAILAVRNRRRQSVRALEQKRDAELDAVEEAKTTFSTGCAGLRRRFLVNCIQRQQHNFNLFQER